MNMEISTDIFSKCRHALSNEDLGTLAIEGRAWSPHSLGKLLRIAMDVLEAQPAGEVTEITKSFKIGEDFYDLFDKWSRRSVSTVASRYDTSPDAIIAAVKADDNFELIRSRDGATMYVRLVEKLR